MVDLEKEIHRNENSSHIYVDHELSSTKKVHAFQICHKRLGLDQLVLNWTGMGLLAPSIS